MMKFTASAFMLLICTAALQSTKEGRPKRTPLRCQCLKTYSGRPISGKVILSVMVIPAGQLCKNDEIIATLKNGKTCLNPADDWVISLKEK
ncbi:interleukin-8-like [Carassius gibelio]|uniref:interleukin-8-like n=1 Tax=Carassius gibelio TaxID=101364 RepID=UPI0022790BF5|nr:interleukin-8-like [Carassius gibelio]